MQKSMQTSTTTEQRNHFFYLAPIRGITDASFRRIYHHHFPHFNAAVAPFLNPQRQVSFKERFFLDILPENNREMTVIPQLIHNNPEDFLHVAHTLEGLGYTHINWNLGCPAPMVANKKRGSGFLPYPEEIMDMLETILPRLQAEISVKVRLGFHSSTELLALLPRLNDLPLKEIIIHPRIGKQLYRGSTDLDSFAVCTTVSSHILVYNGDITTAEDFSEKQQRFQKISRWMIGRGALANPFLVAEIQGDTFSPQQKLEKLKAFHDDLFQDLRNRLSGPGHILSKMKQLWQYLASSFPENSRLHKQIRKTGSIQKYLAITDDLFSRRCDS